jgi:hypothetical protein
MKKRKKIDLITYTVHSFPQGKITYTNTKYKELSGGFNRIWTLFWNCHLGKGKGKGEIGGVLRPCRCLNLVASLLTFQIYYLILKVCIRVYGRD